MENWNYAHSASSGVVSARRYAYNYEMGLGYGTPNYENDGLKLPGLILDSTEAKAAEQNQRGFYRRWAEFMDAEDWDGLANWRNGSGHE